MVVVSYFIIVISFAVSSEVSQPERSFEHLQYKLSNEFHPTEKFGQVTAVAINSNGNIVIFHRGPVRWDTK